MYETVVGTPTAAQIADAAGWIQSFYVGTIMPKVATTTTFDSMDTTPLDGTSGAVHVGFSFPGTGSGDSLPPECAAVITLRTADRGRRARGRIYLPPFVTSAVGPNGHLDSSIVSSVLTGCSGMQSSMIAINWQLGVASYGRSVKVNYTTTPKTYAVTTWTPFITGITNFSMDDQVDVMRSRKN